MKNTPWTPKFDLINMAPGYFMKVLMLLFFVVSLQFTSTGQELIHHQIAGGGGLDDLYFISSDKNGDFITMGTYSEELYTQLGQKNPQHNAKGWRTYYLAKWDRYGKIKWIKNLENQNSFIPRFMHLDSKSNIYIGINFNYRVDVDPGPDSVFVEETTQSAKSTSYYDFVLVKLDTAGNYVDHGLIPHTDVHGIEIDSSDHIYLTGYLRFTTDMDPSSGYLKASPADSSKYGETYVLKLNTNLSLNWYRQFPGFNNRGLDVKSTTDGGVLASGIFSKSVDADPDTGVHMLYPADPTNGGRYTIKLDRNGQYKWGRTIGGDIATDPHGNFYTIRDFIGSYDLDPSSDQTIVKTNSYKPGTCISMFDSTGKFKWGQQLGHPSASNFKSNLVCDSQSVYTVGYTYDADRFRPIPSGLGKPPFKSAGYIAKFDSSGTLAWTSFLGGVKAGFNDLVLDYGGFVNITGYFGDSIHYWYGKKLETLHAYPKKQGYNYSGDGVLLRLGQCKTDSFLSLDTIAACERLYDYENETWIDSSGYHYFREKVPGFCSKLVRKYVQVSYSTYDTVSISACDSFTSFRGIIYQASDTIQDTLVNQMGCDSFLTIYLTVLEQTSDTISISECDFILSPSQNKVWYQSGTYYDTITNSNGCDSALVVNAVIREKSFGQFTQTSCDPLLSPSQKHVWNTTGIYLDTMVNVNGCDSIITIDFTRLSPTSVNYKVEACDAYSSSYSAKIWNQTGVHYDTIANSVGCDSIIIYDLTVHPSSTNTIDVHSCTPWTTTGSKEVLIHSGWYLDTLQTSQGCDSILHIEFTRDSLLILQSPQNKTGEVGDTLQFSVDVDANSTVSYEWQERLLGGTFTTLTGSKKYTGVDTASLIIHGISSVNDSAEYRCIITVEDCLNTSEIALVLLKKTNALPPLQPEVSAVYPNPSTGVFHLQLNGTGEDQKYKVYNSIQQLVGEGHTSQRVTRLDLSNMPNGIYFLKIEGQSSFTFKLMVDRH